MIQGPTIAYAWDTLNRLATKTVPSSPTVSYGYDLAGRQTSVSDTSAAITPVAMPGSTVTYATTYTYDRLNRPTAVSFDPAPTAASPAAGPVVTFGHSYNKANQRTGETTTDSTWIGYPAASASTTAYSANSLNQYTAVGAVTPTYDGNGNLTSDGTYTFGYDAENRLISASGAGNTSSYAFDGRGRRKTRTVNGTTTVSVTDADNREVLEYDGSTGTPLRWYAYGLGPNAVVSQLNLGASTRNTLIPNLLGSIVGSYDSAGALTKFGYQPYGSGTAAPQFAYTGQRIDPETGGLYYYRARHYSTAFGRFLQPDPIGYSDGTLLYAYAQNDPLNLLDPFGLNAEGSGGSSFGQNLLQSTITTLVPGAYYSGLAQQQFEGGNYGYATLYGAASLADAALGLVTFGLSTRLTATVRTTESTVSRGLSQLGGIFTSETNAAGGRVVTAAGSITQNDIAPLVNSGMYRGSVNLISGVHGEVSGAIRVDSSLYLADVARFGSYPGVTVHNFPEMTAEQIRSLLRGPGTTIGGFCNSGACLAPYR